MPADNDRKEGMDKKYFAAGKAKEETEYLGGIKEGTFNKYYFSGQIAVEGRKVDHIKASAGRYVLGTVHGTRSSPRVSRGTGTANVG